MPRPFKCRHIGQQPGIVYFKPRGIPVSQLQEITLTLDEFEALRLADLEGLYQEDAARCMRVSRQTFGNIISSARRKVAEAIVQGKALKIEGGIYTLAGTKKFSCHACAHEWEIPYGTGRPVACPQCKNSGISRLPDEAGPASAGGCRHGRRRRRCGRTGG